MVERKEYVAPVAPDVQILRLGREHQRVKWQVRLDEPTVGLGFERCKLYVSRRYAQVDPWREFADVDRFIAAEHELSDDLLCPRRSGLCICPDHDVVVAELEIVPDPGIHVMVLYFARLARLADLALRHESFDLPIEGVIQNPGAQLSL